MSNVEFDYQSAGMMSPEDFYTKVPDISIVWFTYFNRGGSEIIHEHHVKNFAGLVGIRRNAERNYVHSGNDYSCFFYPRHDGVAYLNSIRGCKLGLYESVTNVESRVDDLYRCLRSIGHVYDDAWQGSGGCDVIDFFSVKDSVSLHNLAEENLVRVPFSVSEPTLDQWIWYLKGKLMAGNVTIFDSKDEVEKDREEKLEWARKLEEAYERLNRVNEFREKLRRKQKTISELQLTAAIKEIVNEC